ncbi:hypothetical protein CYLTODRAFT_441850 [Cylindrobasidium torrendii FP15055 ss-10]|uniref:Uncharacterized protein n=1 Tax=Cylindrobasidium torrendii FP15055 ss-10 TaxID=1314674 RepID=A0A0D7BJ97_9AGAR|nr:hypothetical protein CYLTODRAFT_441850 [Cylindrobasidium torrendii FP15055 ss-10]
MTGTPPASSLSNLKFHTIGQQPKLLGRFHTPDLESAPSPPAAPPDTPTMATQPIASGSRSLFERFGMQEQLPSASPPPKSAPSLAPPPPTSPPGASPERGPSQTSLTVLSAIHDRLGSLADGPAVPDLAATLELARTSLQKSDAAKTRARHAHTAAQASIQAAQAAATAARESSEAADTALDLASQCIAAMEDIAQQLGKAVQPTTLGQLQHALKHWIDNETAARLAIAKFELQQQEDSRKHAEAARAHAQQEADQRNELERVRLADLQARQSSEPSTTSTTSRPLFAPSASPLEPAIKPESPGTPPLTSHSPQLPIEPSEFIAECGRQAKQDAEQRAREYLHEQAEKRRREAAAVEAQKADLEARAKAQAARAKEDADNEKRLHDQQEEMQKRKALLVKRLEESKQAVKQQQHQKQPIVSQPPIPLPLSASQIQPVTIPKTPTVDSNLVRSTQLGLRSPPPTIKASTSITFVRPDQQQKRPASPASSTGSDVILSHSLGDGTGNVSLVMPAAIPPDAQMVNLRHVGASPVKAPKVEQLESPVLSKSSTVIGNQTPSSRGASGPRHPPSQTSLSRPPPLHPRADRTSPLPDERRSRVLREQPRPQPNAQQVASQPRQEPPSPRRRPVMPMPFRTYNPREPARVQPITQQQKDSPPAKKLKVDGRSSPVAIGISALSRRTSLGSLPSRSAPSAPPRSPSPVDQGDGGWPKFHTAPVIDSPSPPPEHITFPPHKSHSREYELSERPGPYRNSPSPPRGVKRPREEDRHRQQPLLSQRLTNGRAERTRRSPSPVMQYRDGRSDLFDGSGGGGGGHSGIGLLGRMSSTNGPENGKSVWPPGSPVPPPHQPTRGMKRSRGGGQVSSRGSGRGRNLAARLA